MNGLNDMNCAVEWYVKRHKDFAVTAKAFTVGGKWYWNVYAYIYNTHPLFDKPSEAVEELPFHCGCTFDKIRTTVPGVSGSPKTETLVLGSDYAHMDDSYDSRPSGFGGVPGHILHDANRLVTALLKHTGEVS